MGTYPLCRIMEFRPIAKKHNLNNKSSPKVTYRTPYPGEKKLTSEEKEVQEMILRGLKNLNDQKE